MRRRDRKRCPNAAADALTAVSAERDKAEANHRRAVRLNNDLVDSKMLLVAHFAKATAAGERILADALKVSAERDSFKRQAEHFAMRGNIAEAEADRLRKAITDALAWLDDERLTDDQHIGGARANLRAALDKEGNDDA